METIFNYLKQPSTYRGLTILAGAFGYYINPELLNLIASLVAGGVGLIELARNEQKLVTKSDGSPV